MRIAIVEDEKHVADHIAEMLRSYADFRGVMIESVTYSCALAFLEDYKYNYDVVLMDIDLPDINGMQAAERLRERDNDVILIFVTNMAQYAVKGYMVGAFDFVVKPVIYNHLCQVLDRAKKAVDMKNREFKVYLNKPNGVVALNASEIAYVEITSHTLIYHANEKEIAVTGKMSAVEESLSGYGFARCNSCYLVNLRFVEAVEGFTAKVGGDCLQISRARRKPFLAALTKFINGD